MGIFDDVVVNARSAAETVSKKAGKLVEASKLRIQAAELRAEISKKYEALGEYVCESCQDVLSSDPEAAEMVSEIYELKAQHASVLKDIGEKQSKHTCPECGKKSSTSAHFCSNCGAKLGEEETAEEEPEEEENE